jgi:O-antigen/teichoic acid export membrane protein
MTYIMIENSNFYNKVKTNTLVALFSTGLSILLATAIMPVLIVSVGTENWARYAFFLLYVAALQCVEAALQSYTLQVRATANSTGGSYEWWHDRALQKGMLWLGFAACLAVSTNHAFSVMSDSGMRTLFSLAVVNVFPRALSAVLKGNLLGQQNQARYYLFTTVFNVGRPLFLLLCLWVAGIRSVVTLATLYVFFSLFEMTVLWHLLRKERTVQILKIQQLAGGRQLLPALLAGNLMSTLSTNIDKILAYNSLNLRMLGEYTFASQIAALLNVFVNSAVSAFTPRFRELYLRRDNEQIRRDFMLLSALNNFLVFAAAVIFLINSEFLLSVFKGQVDHKTLLSTFAILAGAALFSSNLWFPGAIATSAGKPYYSIFTNIVFIGCYLLLLLVLQGIFDDSVFALSMMCSSIVTTSAGLIYFKIRVLDFSLARYFLVSMALPLLIVGITYIVPILLLKNHFGGALPGLAFTAAWLCVLIPIAVRSRHLLATKATAC